MGLWLRFFLLVVKIFLMSAKYFPPSKAEVFLLSEEYFADNRVYSADRVNQFVNTCPAVKRLAVEILPAHGENLPFMCTNIPAVENMRLLAVRRVFRGQ